MAWDEVQQLESVEDCFQITDVVSALEEEALLQLSLEAYGEVLTWRGGCWMQRLEDKALKMAVVEFQEFARNARFIVTLY